MKKKLAAALTALFFCFVLISCGEDTPATEPTDTATAPKTAEEVTTEEEFSESDLIDDVKTWIGFAEEGTLEKAGEQKVYHIGSAADLDPFREHLRLTEEEEKSLFLNERDHVFLIEIVSSTERSAYGIDSIYWEGIAVTVEIQEDETEEITPSHTFILFHMPHSLIGDANVSIDILTF